MFGRPQMHLLNGKYTLVKSVHQRENHSSTETWLGIDNSDKNEYLIRLWPYEVTKLQRALWDSELRKLYRVSSSPGSENFLLTLRDAGVDEVHHCFVMVTVAKGYGYTPLDQLLQNRSNGTWLDTKNSEIRQRIWLGLLKIVRGIDILHSQNVLHRNISAENIFLHHAEGPESFLLGGFEWSLRISEFLYISSRGKGALPPDQNMDRSSVFRLEDDWYAFGLLAGRCLVNVESCYVDNSQNIYDCILSNIESTTGSNLTALEKSLILRLISSDNINRLVHSYQILNDIQEIVTSLDIGALIPGKTPKLVLTYAENQCDELREQATRSGWVVNPNNKFEEFNPRDLYHLMSFNEFLQMDFRQAQIHYYQEDQYILLGETMCLMIRKVRIHDDIIKDFTESWDAAYASKTAYLYSNPDRSTMQSVPIDAITVMTISRFKKNPKAIKDRISWERYLPSREIGLELRENMRRLYDFVRCTNQLELLFRDAELFQYTVKSRKIDEGQKFETIEIVEKPRERKPVTKFVPTGGLVEYVQREMEKEGLYSKLIILTSADNGSLRIPVDLEPSECYTIVSTNKDEATICLERAFHGQDDRAPESGWLKVFGMRGQTKLIRRRQQAIYRLQRHTYLLKSLIATGDNYIDTGLHKLPLSIPTTKVDEAKQAVMQDVLRIRPIYALQGPPGTGKTTLVAHLLRQIFSDDPVAQVLITAQAHGAVDVLQRKVVDEAFADVPKAEQPLAIRLGIRNQDNSTVDETSASLKNVSIKILDDALRSLKKLDELSDLQLDWQKYAQTMRRAISEDYLQQESLQETPEFVELVKRSANIVYSTTSAGDLEALARDTQQYDWSIIEEAGKCHAFDLALPMQAGHRWLLIGDQKQLDPYLIDEHKYAIENLPEMVAALKELPDKAGGLLDFSWIERWETMDLDSQREFIKFGLEWLETFDKIFINCSIAPNGPNSPELHTTDKSIGANAGKLMSQYRMHPTIGDLISETYYDGKLVNCTVDESGESIPRVSLSLDSPGEFQGVGLVWVDTPSASESNLASEGGRGTSSGASYKNPFEANVIKGILRNIKFAPNFLTELQSSSGQDNPLTLSILSPYIQQVSELSKRIRIEDFPAGVRPQAELASTSSASRRLIHTVDSFQGNEADIIIISLVRNNQLVASNRNPLGFLTEKKRLNVLFSRAQRLMILVGSWKFFYDHIRTTYPLADKHSNEWHLAKAFSMINQWFDEGRAIRVDASKYVDYR